MVRVTARLVATTDFYLGLDWGLSDQGQCPGWLCFGLAARVSSQAGLCLAVKVWVRVGLWIKLGPEQLLQI